MAGAAETRYKLSTKHGVDADTDFSASGAVISDPSGFSRIGAGGFSVTIDPLQHLVIGSDHQCSYQCSHLDPYTHGKHLAQQLRVMRTIRAVDPTVEQLPSFQSCSAGTSAERYSHLMFTAGADSLDVFVKNTAEAQGTSVARLLDAAMARNPLVLLFASFFFPALVGLEPEDTGSKVTDNRCSTWVVQKCFMEFPYLAYCVPELVTARTISIIRDNVSRAHLLPPDLVFGTTLASLLDGVTSMTRIPFDYAREQFGEDAAQQLADAVAAECPWNVPKMPAAMQTKERIDCWIDGCSYCFPMPVRDNMTPEQFIRCIVERHDVPIHSKDIAFGDPPLSIPAEWWSDEMADALVPLLQNLRDVPIGLITRDRIVRFLRFGAYEKVPVELRCPELDVLAVTLSRTFVLENYIAANTHTVEMTAALFSHALLCGRYTASILFDTVASEHFRDPAVFDSALELCDSAACVAMLYKAVPRDEAVLARLDVSSQAIKWLKGVPSERVTHAMSRNACVSQYWAMTPLVQKERFKEYRAYMLEAEHGARILAPNMPVFMGSSYLERCYENETGQHGAVAASKFGLF